MLKHFFKMVWNRKRTNALFVAEIFVSFIVLFAVVALAVYSLTNYRRPLGFEYENVWRVNVGMQVMSDDTFSDEERERLAQVLATARALPGVEGAAATLSTPWSLGGSNSSYTLNGKRLRYEVSEVTDDFKDVVGLRLTQGRWFAREDVGAGYRPVVINENLARDAFGNESPLGKTLTPPRKPGEDVDPEEKVRLPTRVVGVITDFRKSGELSGPDNFLFRRASLEAGSTDRPPRNLLVRVAPGTPRTFEETLVKSLQPVAPGWSFEVTPLVDERRSSLRLRLAPMAAAGLVAVFLLSMVALGLTGVLWQNVTQRRREIGLRRAKGATERHVLAQILGELFVLTTFGLLLATAILVQIPILGVFSSLTTGVFVASLLLSMGLMYGLTSLCGLYPSLLATRVPPAEALHYE